MRLTTSVLVFLSSLVLPAASGAPDSLYEWLAVARTVVTAQNVGSQGKYTEFLVEEVLRGEATPDTSIRVMVRKANRGRDRDIDDKPLRLDEGESYLLLLAPAATRKPDAPPTFELVRGVRGSLELPREGRPAFLAAVERFIDIQDQRDEQLVWRQLEDMLEDTNPILIETALSQFLKFRRGDTELIGTLRPLLEHPSQVMRERSVLLISQILMQRDEGPLPDAAGLKNELVSRARRDGAVPVRIAATQALGHMDDESIQEILEEIAREDPDQNVRYAAERLIYDRRQREVEGNEGRPNVSNGT